MSAMHAVVYDPPEHFEVREIAIADPGPGEVLVEVAVADSSVVKSVIAP